MWNFVKIYAIDDVLIINPNADDYSVFESGQSFPVFNLSNLWLSISTSFNFFFCRQNIEVLVGLIFV